MNCANCSVDVGLCPNCGTYWLRYVGKRIGVRPITTQGPTVPLIPLEQRNNVVVRYRKEES